MKTSHISGELKLWDSTERIDDDEVYMKTIQIVELRNGEIARGSLSQDLQLVGLPEPCNFSSRSVSII